MGKHTGFLEIPRKTAPKRPVEERIHDYREYEEALSDEELSAQAARCMDCGVPFCHQGCPLGNLIPDWNDLVYRGRPVEAADRLHATNNFPEMTGRLCPAPCEAACVAGLHGDPVSIKQVERAIADHALASGGYAPRPATKNSGRRVAIVGSGPAGLACAQQLARAGHAVVVFERSDRIGGLLRYGIPDFKMDKALIDRRVEQMQGEGVEFRPGVTAGVSPTGEALLAEFDAVVLATGALDPRGLDVPGRELQGVVLALDYLEQQNRIVAGETIAPELRIDAHGKRVVILGGGDTGADCLGTAHRQGAASVLQLEIAPRPADARGTNDPWPLWPQVYRSSPAHEEGGEREFATMTVALEGEAGALRRLRTTRCEPKQVDGRTEFSPIPGTEATIDADLLLIATGYTGPEPSPLYAQLGVRLDRHGRVEAGDDGRTSHPRVYVAGDARRGASLIVWAIAEGRKAAASVRNLLGDVQISSRSSLPVLQP